jgi:hypothetical protein
MCQRCRHRVHEVLKCLGEDIRRKHSEKRHIQDRTTKTRHLIRLCVLRSFQPKAVWRWSCTPNSQYLGSCDIFLISKTTIQLKIRIFEDIVLIQCESQVVLDGVTKLEFGRHFQEWERPWVSCITSKGNSFEGVCADLYLI